MITGYKPKPLWELLSFYLALAVEGGGSGAVGFAAQPQRQQPSAPSGKTMPGVVIGERFVAPEPPMGQSSEANGPPLRYLFLK